MLGIMSAASTEALYLEEILSDVVQDSKVARVLMEICREGESDGVDVLLNPNGSRHRQKYCHDLECESRQLQGSH